MKKAGVVAVVVLMLLLAVAVVAAYVLIGVPIWFTAIAIVAVVIVGAALIYYAMERFKEIEEGLDDAVDDY